MLFSQYSIFLVKPASATETWSDSFADSSKISSSTGVLISGGKAIMDFPTNGTWQEDPDGTPVVDRGASEKWDDDAVDNPFIAKFGDTYYLFYEGMAGTTEQIGLATSSDGENFTKVSVDNPILAKGSASDWDEYAVRIPAVIQKDSTYYLFYTGTNGDTASNYNGVGVATSTDLTNWTKYGSNPVLPNVATTWEAYVTTYTSIMNTGSEYAMLYRGMTSVYSNQRSGLATSTDLLNWSKDADNPVISDGEMASCTSFNHNGIYYGTCTVDETNTYYYSSDYENWTSNGTVTFSSSEVSTLSSPISISGTYYIYYEVSDRIYRARLTDTTRTGDMTCTASFSDTFDDNNIDDWSDSVNNRDLWGGNFSKPSVSSGIVSATEAQAMTQTFPSAISGSDFHIEVRIKFSSTGSNKYLEIDIGNRTAPTGYEVQISSMTNKIEIDSENFGGAGASTPLASVDYTFSADTWYLVDIFHKTDNTWEIHVDGTPLSLGTNNADSSFSSYEDIALFFRDTGVLVDYIAVVDNDNDATLCSAPVITENLVSTTIQPDPLNNWGEFSWSDSEPSGASVTCFVQYNNAGSWELIPDGDLSGNSSGFGTSPVDLSGLSTTTYTQLRLKAEFATNDFSQIPYIDSWQVTNNTDDTPPSISLTALSPDPNTDNTPSITGTATEETGTVSNVQYQMDGTSGSWTACSADDGSFDEASEDFTCTISSALSDGSHTIYVRATDSNSNTTAGGSESSDTFTIDTTIPTVSLTAISPDPGADNTPTISGTATDALTVLTTIQYQVDSTSGSWSSCSADDGSIDETSESFTCTPSALSDGSHTIYVRSTDNASNSSSNATDSFTVDTTAPASFDLDSPGNNSYTNSERPTFKWKAASTPDATSGLSKYKLEIDNGDSGDFTIDDIPTSRTTDYETKKYLIHYENFSDSDNSNNYISVYTKSSSDWGSDDNDGKLKEGKRTWKVIARDNAGNERTESRTLFVDRSGPSMEVTQINETAFSESLATADKTPTVFGKITDSLAGDKTDNKVASGPKEVEIKFEKRNYLGIYSLHTLTTVNINELYWSSDGSKITDNSKNTSNKYSTFSYTPTASLPLGTYKITLTGKDKASNSGSAFSFNLMIKTFEEVVKIPEVEKTIEELEKEGISKEEIEEIIKEQGIVVPEELKKPSKIAEGIGEIVVGIINLWWKGVDTGKDLALRYWRFRQETDKKTSAFVVKKGSQGLAFVGKSIAFVGDKTGESLAYRKQKIEETQKAFVRVYFNTAQKTPGVIKGGLLAIGRGREAVNKAVGNVTNKTVEGVKTLASNVEEGVKTTTQAIGKTTSQQTSRLATAWQTSQESISKPASKEAQNLAARLKIATSTFVTIVFDKEPTRISDAKVAEVGNDYVVVTWQTNHYATSKVNYGLTYDYGKTVQSDKRVKEHKIKITGLNPGTKYCYEVMSQNKNYVFDARHEFTTLPEEIGDEKSE